MVRTSRQRGMFLTLSPALVLLAALIAVGLVDPVAGALLAAAIVAGAVWQARRRQAPPLPPQTAIAETPAALDLPAELLEAIPDPVIVLNGAREIVAANAAARETFGIGALGRDLALSLRHPSVLAAVETLAAGVSTLSDEIVLPLRVSQTFMLHATRLSAAGGPRGPRYVLLLQDQTRAKRAEQTRTDFIANASHELRSPLASLIGFIETLSGPASDDAAARVRFLALMHGEAKRMARLIDDLLSLSRVEAIEHIPPREPIDLAETIEMVIETLAPRAEGRRMRLELKCAPNLPPVPGDADQLMQVFHNLIDNAIKYGHPGTAVTIKVEDVEGTKGLATPAVMVQVIDRGDGIAAIHIPRLTERFYRADDGRSRRMGGTGLGLAIVKHIVNRHRGRLIIESEEGVGSTFSVVLPALAKARGEERDDTASRAVS